MFTRQRLTDDLLALGLGTGHTVVVHSSLRSIGCVEGGGHAVLHALLGVVGLTGLLLFPTFTYNGSDQFEPAATPGKTGAIAEVARHWPGAIRSWHPTHSVVAIGQGAAEICAGHHLVGGLAKDSPLDRAAQRNGIVMLVGVGHTSNSTIHIGESHASVRYRTIPFGPSDPLFARVVSATGTIEVPLHEPPGCSRAFGVVEHALRRRGAIRDGTIGLALAQIMPGLTTIATVESMLAEDPTALLCSDSRCYRCTMAKATLQTEEGY